MLSASDVEALLRAELAAEHPGFAVNLEPGDDPVFVAEDGSIHARLMVCSLEDDRSIRDVKSQEIWLVLPEHRADAARTSAFLRQWARGLPAIVEGLGNDAGLLLPCDVYLPMPLRDPTLHSDEDFARLLHDPAQVAAWVREAERAGLADDLSRWGLAERADEFVALRRPAIRFRYPSWIEEDPDAEEPAPIGETRFGGEPDLPPDVPWPLHDSEPMTFAAQIDLDSLRRFAAARELPASGLLSFFYAHGDYPQMPSSVLHIASREGLARRATPPGGDRRPELTADPYGLATTMPSSDSPFYEALLPIEKVALFHRSLTAAGAAPVLDPLPGLEQYLAQWDGYDPETEEHRLLGYAQPYQHDPYLNAEVHTTRGSYDDWDGASPAGIATSRNSRRWRLLLQLWAHIDGELLFNQDCGALYFLIPEDALAAGDWSSVWCAMQCS